MRQACFKFRRTREFNGIVYWYKRASQHAVLHLIYTVFDTAMNTQLSNVVMYMGDMG